MIDESLTIKSDDASNFRLFTDLEHKIKLINSEQISKITGEISPEAFVKVAESTARLRANYLFKVMALQTTDEITVDDIKSLRNARLMFEEAVEGYAALQYALEKGYFSLEGSED